MKSKSVLLIQPPIVFPKLANGTPICPPIGLAYVAGSLEQAGFSVTCLDAVGEAPLQINQLDRPGFGTIGLSIPEILESLPTASQVSAVGVTATFSASWPLTRRLLNELRITYPSALIFAGGEHVSAIPEFCLEDCSALDVCVIGEGEFTSVDLINAWINETSLDKVPGIAFRSRDGIQRSSKRKRISTLDTLAPPAWHLLPLENYLKNRLGFGINLGRSMPMLATRGCPYSCTFCSNPSMWGTNWISRSPEVVVNEILEYQRRYHIDSVDFYDLTAVVRKDWILDFSKKLIASGANIRWQMPAGTRSEALDREVLEYMHKSGVHYIAYAPESGSMRTLKEVNKKIHLDIMLRSMRWAVEVGMNVKLNMVIGFPKDQTLDIFHTLLFIVKVAWIGVQDVAVNVFSAYPGSELFQELQKSGKIEKLDDDYFYGICQDVSNSVSYCETISGSRLTLYKLSLMFAFYSLNFVFRPIRVFYFIRNLVRGVDGSRLEASLLQLARRRFANRSLFFRISQPKPENQI